MLLGIRNNNNGLEFGLGPNLSLSGVGMAFAVGGSLKSDKMYFPINLVFVPSVRKKDYDTQITERTGSRISLLIGFNTRVN
ncbi:MAG: hypothetical protein OEW75_16685 [Cyclobacteriaceae bacterium]|nr:hypothetical protein [Cyclobacteriaceae bacterium]